MTTSHIKIGVLGCSSIARRAVIPAIKECKDFVLSGVSSRDESKAQLYADEFDTNSYSYESLLNSDIDAIYVSLPVGLHYEWGRKVLEAGKHLLMEKTFTQTYEQAKELFELALDKDLACMEALMYEFHPMQQQIDALLSVVGKIKCVEANFGFPHFKDKDNIRYSNELGGGAILDCLIYPLSFIFRILGDNFIDYKSTIFHNEQIGIDERGYIQFEYDDVIANISYGFGHSYRNEVIIWGEESILKAKRAFSRPKDCTLPIEIWHNGQCETHKVENTDHFLKMLYSFSDIVSFKKIVDTDTLKRMSFIEGIKE